MATFLKILLLFILTGSVFATSYYIVQLTSFQSRASSIRTGSFSENNSYVFASPIAARADGEEKIRITIFILDNQGLGVAGVETKIETNSPLIKITPILPTTDETGKSYFELSSLQALNPVITAFGNDRALPQHLTLNFY